MSKSKITILDLGYGNFRSLLNAFNYLNINTEITNDKKKILNAEGILATCIQHEMDHLEGILFIDYLSKLKKSMIIKKLSKSKSERIVV